MPRRIKQRISQPLPETLSNSPDMRYTHAMQELRRSNAAARHRNRKKYRRNEKYRRQDDM